MEMEITIKGTEKEIAGLVLDKIEDTELLDG